MTDEEWQEYRRQIIERHPESLTAALLRFGMAEDELIAQFRASRVYAVMSRFLAWVVRQFDGGKVA